MLDVAQFFDRSGKLARPPARRLAREFAAFVADFPAPPDARDMPRGDGHAVLVLPAYLSADFATAPLRRFLNACGYRAHGWGLGVNWGPTPRILAGVRARLADLRAASGRPVTLIGVSLGGLLARDLAHDRPADVRQVITLASPFRLPTAASIEPFFRLTAPFYSPAISLPRLSGPLPVPSLAIYTPDDGIVAWQSCRDDGACAEVRGPHTTICRNPDALRLVARRLAEVGERIPNA